MKYVKSNKDVDYSDTVISTFNYLKTLYSNEMYKVRISNIFQLLKDSYGIEEFDLLDVCTSNNGLLDSYLIDKQVDWLNGRDVDFGEIFEKIEEIGKSSKRENELFLNGKIEERIWAIYLLVCNPNLDKLNKPNKNK